MIIIIIIIIIIFILTNCEIHTAKYSNRSFDVPKTKVRIFSLWNEQLVIKTFIV